ncbi:MAG: glycosyltransferase domain-containing protein [Sphingomonas sp.]
MGLEIGICLPRSRHELRGHDDPQAIQVACGQCRRFPGGMMKVHICSAHFGGKPPNILPRLVQKHHDVTQSFYSDENTPSRINCMHPRLKGKIPKMLEHRVHDADWYIWIDSKFVIKSADLASDVIETAGNSQIILYCHPFRSSIREESELIAERISNGDEYLRLTLYRRTDSGAGGTLFE